MPAHKYEALRSYIKKYGLAQELVIREHPVYPTKYEIVDGHHRAKALRELWDPLDLIPCRNATALGQAGVLKLALSLNNNRGELDLSAVSLEIDDLLTLGESLEDLQIVGYTIEELEALQGATLEISDDMLLEDAIIAESARPGPMPKGVFPLEIELLSAKELRTAKSRLKKAGGKGNKDLARGLRALLGLDEGNQ